MTKDDPRSNKDWIQIWYQLAHSDLQWAKGQSWNGVQWSVLLLAAVFAASRERLPIPVWAWYLLTAFLALAGGWWQLDLHDFAKQTRKASEGLVKDLAERPAMLPSRPRDPHHVRLLIIRLLVILGAALITSVQICSANRVVVTLNAD